MHVYLTIARYVREEQSISLSAWIALPDATRVEHIESALMEKGADYFIAKAAEGAIVAVPPL